MSRLSSPLRERMIFLVGARRSGTNWLQRVLGAHPDVALIPAETYLFSRGIAPLRERFRHGLRGSTTTGFIFMERDDLLDALRDFCDRALLPFLEAAPGASRLVERTPEHATCVDVIGDVYPDAHVIHIVRDGRDVARSLLSQTWASAPKTIEDAAEEWRSAVESADRAGRNLERYRTVSYEELLADPFPRVTDLYTWLGLHAEAKVVEATLVEAEVRFNVDPRAPVVAAGKWREALTENDVSTFMRVAGDSLKRLGYDAEEGLLASPGEGPPAVAPARRRRRRKRRLPEGDDSDAYRTLMRQVAKRAPRNVAMFDRLLAALKTRRTEELADMTTDSVSVKFVGRDEHWKGRGPAAWARLAEAIRADDALDGRQVRGDMHVGVPIAAVVMTFRSSNGSTTVRAIVASFTKDRISAVTYYQLPFAG